MSDPLRTYREKRDLSATPEPAGEGCPPAEQPLFVVQKHAASSLHYDLRLEADGVLKSWAVPKGPSTDPRAKRLATRTEDHPLSYADFEGVIPAEQYGGGTVLVWDIGPLSNLTTDDNDCELPLGEAIESGHCKVWLEGEKLRGAFALTNAKVGGREDNWLLVKVDDEAADARRNPVSTEPRSVLTGRELEEITAEEPSHA